MTLSSGYLEQLSILYKKQIEDLQLSVRQANDALAAASSERKSSVAEVALLKAELGAVTSQVAEITSQLQTISAWVIYYPFIVAHQSLLYSPFHPLSGSWFSHIFPDAGAYDRIFFPNFLLPSN